MHYSSRELVEGSGTSPLSPRPPIPLPSLSHHARSLPPLTRPFLTRAGEHICLLYLRMIHESQIQGQMCRQSHEVVTSSDPGIIQNTTLCYQYTVYIRSDHRMHIPPSQYSKCPNVPPCPNFDKRIPISKITWMLQTPNA